MRLSSLEISNFKAYGKEYRTLPIKPVTLIFGPNSAGKSSALHSLLWMNHAIIRKDADVYEPIGAHNAVSLGGFDSCLTKNSENQMIRIRITATDISSGRDDRNFEIIEAFTLVLGISKDDDDPSPWVRHWQIEIDGKIILAGRADKSYGTTSQIDLSNNKLFDSKEIESGRAAELIEIFNKIRLASGAYTFDMRSFFPGNAHIDHIDKIMGERSLQEYIAQQAGSGTLTLPIALRIINMDIPGKINALLNQLSGIIENMIYVPPLRSIPERFENLRVCPQSSWRALAAKPHLIDPVNQHLENLGVPHSLELRKLVDERGVTDANGYLVQMRLRDIRTGAIVNLQDVGVGTGQVLPIVIESFANQSKLIAIEQPEIQIHPRLQAELGDIFIESALGENKNTFLLETHSEHLILRILRRIRETTRGKMDLWPNELREMCPNGIKPEDVAAGQMGLGRLVELLGDFRRDVLLVETDAWRVDAEVGERVNSIPNEFQHERKQIKDLLTWIRRNGPIVLMDGDDVTLPLSEFAESVAKRMNLDFILAPGESKRIEDQCFRATLAACHTTEFTELRNHLSRGRKFETGETDFNGVANECFRKLVTHAESIRVFDYALGEYYINDQPENLKKLARYLRDHAPLLERLEILTMDNAKVSLDRDVRDLQNEVDFEIRIDYRAKKDLPHPRYLGADKRYLDIDRGIDLCDANGRCRKTIIKYAPSPD